MSWVRYVQIDVYTMTMRSGYPSIDLEFMKKPNNSRWGRVNIEMNYTVEDLS